MKEDITRFQPTVSANDLVNPQPPVQPPVPEVQPPRNTTGAMVDNVTNNTQSFIQAQTEEAKKQQEMANLLFDQTFNGQGQREQLSKQYQLPENMARLQDIQTQLAKANTASDMTKARIQGAAGQTLGQAGREVTQQDRENAIRNAGLAAEAAVLQGSVETATTLVTNAMSDYYNDRQLKNQNMLNQLNYYSDKVSGQEAQLIEAEKRKYEEDQAQIERVLTSVDSALATGSASVEEMRTLTNPKATDEQRLMVAQGILARSAQEQKTLDLQSQKLGMDAQRATIANIYDQIAQRRVASEEKVATAKTEEEKVSAEKEAASEKALGIVAQAQELLGHSGLGLAVGPNPLARMGTTMGVANFFTGDKADFQAKADQLKNLLTLDNLNLMSGVLTDKDIEILSGAASRLGATNVSEATYKEAIQDIIDTSNRAIAKNGVTDEQAKFYFGFDDSDINYLNDLYGTSNTSTEQTATSFNPASYY